MKINHFVVIRLSALGDVALTTGVLYHLYTKYNYTFSIITRTLFAPLFENHPAITQIHTLPPSPPFLTVLNTARSLAKQYPHSPLIDLHGTIRSSIFSYFWKAPTIVYPKKAKERRQFLRRKTKELSSLLCTTSVTQRYYLSFSPYINNEELPSAEELSAHVFLTEEEKKECLEKFSPPSPVIAIHPYATHDMKIWPHEYWEELISLLQKQGYQVIILGKAEKVFSSSHVPSEYNFTNRTTVRETLALLEHAEILITTDSGLMHLATATDTPSVALFGPTTKEWGFFPPSPSVVLEDKSLACRPCSLHGNTPCPYSMECLYNIEPQYVFYQVEQLLYKMKRAIHIAQ